MEPAALTLPFSEVDSGDLPRVGGKGANLAVLARAGVAVPPGFCVTTRAFDLFIASLPNAETRFGELERLDGSSVEDARGAAESMRSALERLPVPDEVAHAVTKAWRALGTEHPLAVRSSATAEDLPGASFAGQLDTYLNVRGEGALLDAVKRKADRKSTRLKSSHTVISYAVFCLKKKRACLSSRQCVDYRRLRIHHQAG